MKEQAEVRWLTPTELRTWRSILEAQSLLMSALDRELLSEHDLGLSDYDVFVQLSEAPDGALRMADLARAVLLSPSGLTRRLDGLVRSGFVERKPCPSDGRGLLAVLTEAGRQKMVEMAPTHLRGVREHFIDLISEDEMLALSKTFERVIRAQKSDDAPISLI